MEQYYSVKNNLSDITYLSELIPHSFFMVQESIEHFPIPLRKSLKVIGGDDFLERKQGGFNSHNNLLILTYS